MKNETILVIFLISYLITLLIYIYECYKMHKNNDSGDPFCGSHIVAVLFLIGLIPIVNTFIGIFMYLIKFLEFLKERKS